jgi:hypothetical protein
VSLSLTSQRRQILVLQLRIPRCMYGLLVEYIIHFSDERCFAS